MFGVFGIFFLELIAFRVGTQRLKDLGFDHDPHGHGVAGGSHAAHGPEHYVEPSLGLSEQVRSQSDTEKSEISIPHNHRHHGNDNILDDPIPQIIGIGILEFGVLLHSVLIGLTLAVDPQFKILFVVIIFHRE